MLYLLMFFAFCAEAVQLKGTAIDLASKQPAYVEIHNITLNSDGLNQKIETKYYKPDGRFFAQMTSDFSKSLTIPEVSFSDSRFNKIEQITLDEKKKSVVFKSIFDNKESTAKEVSLKEQMVAAQGFDNFVKINFEKLSQGTVPLSFGVLSEMDFFSFKGYKRNSPNNERIHFGIKLTNLLYRLFVSELVLEYDAKTKQILKYKGLSNLLNDNGKPQNVQIHYEKMTEAAK